MAKAPALPAGFELPLEPRLPRIGSVDAVALLRLDVFTAVMTGNIVLLGLAVGQGAFGNALRSVIALVAYAVGVVVGARIVGAVAIESHWSPKATRALAIEWVLQAAFLTGWLLTGAKPDGVGAATLIAFSGVAMGIQAATARALAPANPRMATIPTVTPLPSSVMMMRIRRGTRSATAPPTKRNRRLAPV